MIRISTFFTILSLVLIVAAVFFVVAAILYARERYYHMKLAKRRYEHWEKHKNDKKYEIVQ